jgi:UTP--glucose-1-phosphate uridylyltransferase
MKIRKAVIPAAGYGTRFLPATKASPKEMLPVVDKPVIQYVVEEAVASGIEHIIIITGANKRAIEDHFDYNFELEYRLKQSGKDEMYEEIRAISDMANFTYIRQKEQLGNGHAILCAEEVVKDEPFIVLWGDDFIYSDPPRCKQLIDVHNKYNSSVISVMPRLGVEDASKYGFIKGSATEKGIYKVEELVEKPGIEKRPSELASLSGFLLTPDVFKVLKELKPGQGGEIWLSEAINEMAKQGNVYAKQIENGKFYDCGNKLEYIKANIDFAMKRSELANGMKTYMQEILKEDAVLV